MAVKNICLARGEESFWNAVETYLRGSNAELTVLDGGSDPAEVNSLKPDLLVMGNDFYHGLGFLSLRVHGLVVTEAASPADLRERQERKNIRYLDWPVGKKEFLEMTAAILGIPPRREFRTIIRVFEGETDFGRIGSSLDFSMSGMSFRSDHRFALHDKVRISLSLPKAGEQLVLRGVIAREVDGKDGGEKTFGVKFGKLDYAAESALKTFILD